MTPETRAYVKALRAEAAARRKEAVAQLDIWRPPRTTSLT